MAWASAFGQRLIPGFGFDGGEFGVAVDEDVVGEEGFGAASEAFEAAEGDGIFAHDAAAFDYAPAGGFEGGVDVLGSGLGFVHTVTGEGLVEEGFF